MDWISENPGTAVAVATTVAAIAITAYSLHTPSDPPPRLLLGQSVPVGEKRDGETQARRNAKFADKLVTRVPTKGWEHVETVDDLFREAVKRYSGKNFIGSRAVLEGGARGDFVFKTYQEVQQMADQFAKGLLSLDVKPGDKIGIYSGNCVEWKVAEIACYATSLCIVSLYDTLGPKMVEFILNHAEIGLAICSLATYGKILDACEITKTGLKHLVVFGEVSDTSRAEKLGIRVHSYDEVFKLGRESKAVLVPPKAQDLASIMYTSGTTGEPKGVMLSHSNMIIALAGFEALNPSKEQDYFYLSYLPLAHIMERVTHCTLMLIGATVGFYSGDIRKLRDDFLSLRPTTIVGAPRVYQKIYDNVMNQVEQGSGFKRWLFKTAYEAKRRALAQGKTTPIWDKLVFSKISEKIFGGRVGKLVSGSAPLSVKVHEFLRICFTPNVVEGYGLTETTAGCSMQLDEDVRCGTVGPPVPSLEFKLVDVPQMGYTSLDKPFPRGEVCVRGGSVSKGYYKNKEKTDESFDSEGWFHTGDVGRINEDGTLSIIDRAKNIFKLSLGEYVAPEYLENVFTRSPFVSQCFVYGDSLQPTLVAVVIPEEETVVAWAKKNGINKSFKELLTSPQLKKVVLEDMVRVGKEAKLLSYEFVKDILLDSELFSLENGILTPTMKLKRPECKAKYIDGINKLYENMPVSP